MMKYSNNNAPRLHKSQKQSNILLIFEILLGTGLILLTICTVETHVVVPHDDHVRRKRADVAVVDQLIDRLPRNAASVENVVVLGHVQRRLAHELLRNTLSANKATVQSLNSIIEFNH
jgi:hypothetical protein